MNKTKLIKHVAARGYISNAKQESHTIENNSYDNNSNNNDKSINKLKAVIKLE